MGFEEENHPQITPQAQALERFRGLLSAGEFAQLAAELERPLQPAIRVNRLKANPAEAVQRWAQCYGWQIEPIPFCEDGWWITHSPEPVSQTVEHRLGFYYIQDAASMLPVSLFDLDGGTQPLILDMAASPGGKTTHLVDRSADLGLVVANDSSRDRITMLRLVLQNWGALNTAVTRFPGEQFGAWFPETFDYVLLDAPCSMQNLRSTEARPMQSISTREREMLSGRQERMLLSALQALKVGGQVVYSTCTLEPEEDEAVLDAVLRQMGGAVQLSETAGRIGKVAPALARAELDGQMREFSTQITHAVRLWPHIFNTSGFFAGLLTKHAPLPGERQELPWKASARRELKPLKTRESRDVLGQLEQMYGFDFSSVLSTQRLSLWRNRDVLYAIPDAWWDNFHSLPFQAVGMRVAEEGKDLVPSHEWVARFGSQFCAGVVNISPEQTAAWLRGEDLSVPADASLERGQTVVVRDGLGRLYGRGKLLANRLRNLLPSRLVYG